MNAAGVYVYDTPFVWFWVRVALNNKVSVAMYKRAETKVFEM